MSKKFKYPFGPGITKWIEKPNPKNSLTPKEKNGWFGQLDRVFLQSNLDESYVAMLRHFEHEQFGLVLHCAVRNTSSSDIPWREKQRIKNELFGPEACAIEFFPAESKLVDAANMYHLWMLPDFTFPFGIHDTQDNA